MGFGFGIQGRDYWLKSALVSLLVFFSQAYPYVSFSHTHDELEHSPGLSLLPVEFDSDRLPTHDDEGTHHHSLDQSIDWHLFRPASNRLKAVSDLCCLGTGTISDSAVVQRPATWIAEGTVFPESIPITTFAPRAPPALG